MGPSPRLRGKRAMDTPGPSRPGSIPAPAGETDRGLDSPTPKKVHPRACGGNAGGSINSGKASGPSPRLRGKHLGQGVHLGPLRSIPAPAGETEAFTMAVLQDTVHPRACGGNSQLSRPQVLHHGPSPRLRGKPYHGDAPGPWRRSIPAPAGETCSRARTTTAPGVHPRACGGNFLLGSNLARRLGPSPRLRGKRDAPVIAAPSGGSIPAPAGETA